MKLHDQTKFVPGSFKDQLKYCYFDNDKNKSIYQLQYFSFPYIKKKVSVQAGIDKSCTYLIDGEIKKYPFLDPEVLELRINPIYRDAFDREKATIKLFPIENAIEFYVFIVDKTENQIKFCHPKDCSLSSNEYDENKWRNYNGYCGEFISINEVQTILNKFYSLDHAIKEKFAIMIQKIWRGWYTRFNISWNPNTKIGKYYLEKRIEKDLSIEKK